jgi:hypothetical protein
VRRGVRFRGPARAWIRALAPVRAGIPVPTRGEARASARARMPAATRAVALVHARAAFRTPPWILASVRSGLGAPTRAGGVVRARARRRAPAWARIPGSARVGFLMLAGIQVLALIRVGFRGVGRGGLRAIRAAGFPRAAGLAPGLARNLAPDGRGHRAMVPRPACRSPPRLARWHPNTPRARGGPGMPIKVLARGPATGPGRMPAPGRVAADPGQEWIPGPGTARITGSPRAPTPGLGRGLGLTASRRRGAGWVPTAWHRRATHAVLARRCPASPGPHGLQERGGRVANPVPASGPPTGMAAAVRRTSHGRAAGVPERTPTRCRPVRVHPCPARPPARGAAAATVPARARMRGARRKRSRGTIVRDAVAVAAAGPSRPHRTVRPPWAVVSCWTAARRRAATCCPAGVPRRARTRRGVARGTGTRRRDATRPAAARAQAGPPGGAAPRAGTRRPPGRRTLALRRHVASGSRTEPGLAGEGPGAGPRISTLTWTRPRRTTGPAADPGPPGPVPGPAGDGAVPCCWPCWRSSLLRPVR